MKKKLAVVLLAVIMVFSFAACGGGSSEPYADSPYLGTWEATTVDAMGMQFDVASILGGTMSLTLEASGKATVEADGDSTAGKWEPGDSGIVLKNSGLAALGESGDEELAFTDGEGGTLVLEIEAEGMSMTFTFEKAE